MARFAASVNGILLHSLPLEKPYNPASLMNRLRTRWATRVLAVLLVASLLPVTFATARHVARHTASYADWVRLEIRMPIDDAVVRALEVAEQSRAQSLETFLKAFVEAYEAQHPERPLAEVFSADDLSNEALISYLKGRYLGLVGEAVLPRAALTVAIAVTKHVMKRGTASLSVLTRSDLHRRVWAAALRPTPVPAFVLPLRTRFAARPLGP